MNLTTEEVTQVMFAILLQMQVDTGKRAIWQVLVDLIEVIEKQCQTEPNNIRIILERKHPEIIQAIEEIKATKNKALQSINN